jgi:LmbE family N-acetylglucosaminyl deacetylase
MMQLTLPVVDGDVPLRVLAIGAHSDDPEIGCGGTLLSQPRSARPIEATWVVLSGIGERGDEARASASAFLASTKSSSVQVHEFKDGFFPYVGGQVKEVFEGLKDARRDVVFTHTRDDLHQDHRLVNELTWNTFRDHLVLEYEIPKFDGDLGSPNVFVPLDDSIVDEKMRLLETHFPSQKGKHWFDEELFRGLHRIRAAEAGGGVRYAEGFIGRKLAIAI